MKWFGYFSKNDITKEYIGKVFCEDKQEAEFFLSEKKRIPIKEFLKIYKVTETKIGYDRCNQ